jgi:membrane-associated phospholipid phosphatase
MRDPIVRGGGARVGVRHATRWRLLRWAAGGAIGLGGAILLSIAYVDRPVARYMAAHVHDRLPFMAMAAIGNVPPPLATSVLAVLAIAAAMGARLDRARRVMLVALATVIAIMIKDQLKFDFGRVWPESHPFPGIVNQPSFINDHVFGFFPFHGGSSYASFPSGHTTAITAPMAMLWALAPRYRPVWAGLIGVVVVGLIGADFHFVSDTIAGFGLGVAVAAGTLAVGRRDG